MILSRKPYRSTFLLAISLTLLPFPAVADGPPANSAEPQEKNKLILNQAPRRPLWLPLEEEATHLYLTAQAADTEAAPLSSPPESEEPTRLEPVVVTATKIETPLSQLGSSVTVITEEDIKEQQAEEVLEVLRNVPGVHIMQSGTRGAVTSLFMRGGESRFTLVLIDGIKVNDDNGFYNWAHLSTDNIERIEIVRGPQSALYGSDALSGVINIITKRGEEGPPRFSLSSAAGDHDYFREAFTLSGGTERVGYSASFSRLDTTGFPRPDEDDYSNKTISGRVDLKLTEEANLTFTLRYTKSDLEVAGPFEDQAPDEDEDSVNEETAFGVHFDHFIFPWWEQSLRFSVFHDRNHFEDDEVTSGVPFDSLFDSRSDLRRLMADYQYNFFLAELLEVQNTLTIGATWEQEDGEFHSQFIFPGFPTPPSTFNVTRINRSIYIQDQQSFWGRLFLTAGVRIEDDSQFDRFTSPKFSIAYLIKETGTKIKGSYGKGITAPGFLDLFGATGFSVPNPDLEPEKTKSWDFGLEQDLFNKRLHLEVVYFKQEFRNFIGFELDPLTFIGTAVNLDNADADGIEASLWADLGAGFTLNGSYTFMETESGDDTLTLKDGDDLLRRPKHKYNLNLNYRRGKLNLNCDALFVGERSDLNPSTSLNEDADEYFKFDLAADYQLNQWCTFFTRIENLFDQDYEEVLGFPARRLSFWSGVKLVF